jgi:hypothetical protein
VSNNVYTASEAMRLTCAYTGTFHASKKKMKKILLTLTVLIILISCNSNRQIIPKKDKDRIETFEYKNFKGERIEDNSDIAITRKFFKDNKLIKVKYFDVKDELVKNQSGWSYKNAEWRFEYDDNGNFIRQIAYNSKGEIVDMEGFWNSAIKEYEYNKENQLIKISQFDKMNKLVELGDVRDAITKFSYNEKGQLDWQKSFYANEELIKNGYGFSKYEYNDAGLIKKHIYLFDEGKINQYTLFIYQKGKLVKEDEFNNKDEKMGSVEYIYEKGRLIKTRYINEKGEVRIKEEKMNLNIKGWELNSEDKAKLNFVVLNEANGTTGGEYIFTIDKEGRILNIEESDFKGGVPKFNMDVYNKFKKIKLVRTDSKEVEFKGEIKINVLRQKNSSFKELENRLKPFPNMY